LEKKVAVKKASVVLQGPIHPFTPEIIDHYLDTDIIDEVIVSCWSTDSIDHSDPRVIIVKSDISTISHFGGGNINLQLTTSLTGLKAVKNEVSFKIRTDQQIKKEDFINLYNLFYSLDHKPIEKLDGSFAKSKILCTGYFKKFPYHPRDHIFLGFTEDMISLFNAPLSSQPNMYHDFTKAIRAEAYLGAYYFAQFSEKSKNHITNFNDYMLDDSRLKYEAEAEDSLWYDKIFIVSPIVNIIWKKYGGYEYAPLTSPPSYQELHKPSW
jgi:hypothetical protein